MLNPEHINQDRESQLNKLFGDIPSETEIKVNLPSEGRFYPGKVSSVRLTPVTFEDEKQLASNLKNKVNPVNLLLSKCVHGINSDNLLLIDKLYLLLKLREISYGEKYPARVTCPKCSSENEINIDLSKLVVNNIPADIEDPREIILPKLKKKAKVRFPRVYDEQYLMTQEQIYTNLWRFIESIDGIKDPVLINKAVPKMQIMDVKYIINQVMRQDLGLDPKFILGCDSCGEESVLSVPINENFFSVT